MSFLGVIEFVTLSSFVVANVQAVDNLKDNKNDFSSY